MNQSPIAMAILIDAVIRIPVRDVPFRRHAQLPARAFGGKDKLAP